MCVCVCVCVCVCDPGTMLQDEDIAAEESLREACERAGIGQEVTDNLIGQIATPAVKEELKKATEEALDLGASGWEVVSEV